MSATVFLGGKFRAFTADGSAPLSGGFLYAYKAGTLTPQDTFTDQSGLTANTNPVVLDATGSADVWLTGNYKFVLKDASGVTQWTEDNLSDGIFSTAFSASSTTNLLIGSGNKTFVIQSGKAFAPGQFVVAASNANPNNYMNGSVISYSGTTLVVNVVTTGGMGTFADWNIGISGPAGPQGSTGGGGSGSGNVTGPATATDGNFALFNGTTGQLIKQAMGGPGSAAFLTAGTSPNNVVQLDGSSRLPAVDGSQLTNLPSTSGQFNSQLFTASGTFTTPANITTSTVFKFMLQGGGGGGGYGGSASNLSGGGGAGGGVIYYATGLSPSQAYTITLGGGGASGTSGATTGSSGGTTSVVLPNGTISASGGAGGTVGNSSGLGSGGGGGSGSGTNAIINIGAYGFNGGSGGQGTLGGGRGGNGVLSGTTANAGTAGRVLIEWIA